MSEYILTEVNSQNAPVGTSGAASPDRVEREQANAARHSYRLDADSDTLKDLVGHQVRISGTVAEASDVDQRVADAREKRDKADTMDRVDRSDRAAGTSGTTPSDRDRMKLDDDDLAKVKVDSVDRIADACGSNGAAPAAKKPSAKGKAHTRK